MSKLISFKWWTGTEYTDKWHKTETNVSDHEKNFPHETCNRKYDWTEGFASVLQMSSCDTAEAGLKTFIAHVVT